MFGIELAFTFRMQQMAKKFILTKEGLAHLQGEYDKLTKIQRPAVASRIQTAREFGDLAENSEYDAAKEEQSLLESRITDLELILHKAELIQPTEKTGVVVIGSTVVIEMNDEIHEFSIVGSVEADPALKKISNESPIGKALLNLRENESIEVAIGPVKSTIKVLEIK